MEYEVGGACSMHGGELTHVREKDDFENIGNG
jgi:hypothetical protein